jgi:DNA-binding NtrC family response regulator
MPQLILVVDDDPLAQGDTRRILQLAGYTARTADTAIDALTYLQQGQLPDLAILDLRLPDLPGTRLAARMHARHPRLPILFVSGQAGASVERDAVSTLRCDFLPKPFTQETLLPVVQRLLGSGST